MKNQPTPSDHRKNRRTRIATMATIGMAALGMNSCTSDDMNSNLAGAGEALDVLAQVGGGFVPSEVSQAYSAFKTLQKIAEYKASEKQLADARAKAKRSSSSPERQYIRVRPNPSAGSSGSKKGTHVVAYNPKTGKMDDEVVVVSDTNLKKGDSVSISGQSGKII